MKPLIYAQQNRLRIALFLAARSQNFVDIEALILQGREVGMNGAEMAANQQGTSHDAKGTACLCFVQTLIDNPGPPSSQSLLAMQRAGFSEKDVQTVVAQVEVSTGLAARWGAIAGSEIVNCEQMDSRQLSPE